MKALAVFRNRFVGSCRQETQRGAGVPACPAETRRARTPVAIWNIVIVFGTILRTPIPGKFNYSAHEDARLPISR
jgi:hypothetical protein